MMEIPKEIVQELIEAAKDMPRKTPAAGGCGTIHDFKIEAAVVWALDRVLTKIKKLEDHEKFKAQLHKMLSIDRHNRLRTENVSPMMENFNTELAANPELVKKIEKEKNRDN